jgi:hypothetical protein
MDCFPLLGLKQKKVLADSAPKAIVVLGRQVGDRVTRRGITEAGVIDSLPAVISRTQSASVATLPTIFLMQHQAMSAWGQLRFVVTNDCAPKTRAKTIIP